MATVGNEAIERVKVREVACIFHSRDALAAAVGALLLAGFDRAGIDVIVGRFAGPRMARRRSRPRRGASRGAGSSAAAVFHARRLHRGPGSGFCHRDLYRRCICRLGCHRLGRQLAVGRVRRGRRRRGSCRYRGVDRAGLRPQACQSSQPNWLRATSYCVFVFDRSSKRRKHKIS